MFFETKLVWGFAFEYMYVCMYVVQLLHIESCQIKVDSRPSVRQSVGLLGSEICLPFAYVISERTHSAVWTTDGYDNQALMAITKR